MNYLMDFLDIYGTDTWSRSRRFWGGISALTNISNNSKEKLYRF